LRVIALTSARDQARLCEFDFQVVVFFRPGGPGRIKGDLIVGRGIFKAFLRQAGDIVAGRESKTAALDGEHLET